MNQDGLDLFDLETAARTVWGEARGESQEGRVAVARVIVNRWRADSSATLEAVCRKPKQFSCWNADDPNAHKARDVQWDDATLRACLSAVLEALDPKRPDPTHGSKHYHVTNMQAWWASGRTPVVTIGHHHFYNDVA